MDSYLQRIFGVSSRIHSASRLRFNQLTSPLQYATKTHHTELQLGLFLNSREVSVPLRNNHSQMNRNSRDDASTDNKLY